MGKYDSRVAYGQDGVQVGWNRIIFPDASSIDLSGMVGLDSHGNAGLRDKLHRHYARIVGFSALTSLFSRGEGTTTEEYMAEEVDASRMRAPRKASKVLRVGLVSSGAATAALALTYCMGNRDVGFGRSISEAEQSILLILASLLFVGFAAAYVLPRLLLLSCKGEPGRRP